MNGGMYQDDFQPVGLYVENGRELTRANTATLTGAPSAIPNFFKKPNGVFYIGNGAAGILETGRFLAERPDANFATQSGPMLIVDGAIHPAFIVNSTDRKMRNGVVVTSPTEVHFVITKDRVIRASPFFRFTRWPRKLTGSPGFERLISFGLSCPTGCALRALHKLSVIDTASSLLGAIVSKLSA
jgi:uncharacterized protein YigE (DUF2233 family)